jgi:hypothetical protein
MAKITDQLISNFYNEAIAKDFSRDVNFRVTQIVPDPILNLGSNFIKESDLVYAKAAKLPARNITNQEAKYMGLTFNLPGVVEYPESANYSLEFYCDVKSALRTKFEEWTRVTFNDENSTGNYVVPTRNAIIQLAQIDSQLNIVQEYKLVGVSIRQVGDIEYAIAEGTGSVVSFNATFAYHYYELVGANGGRTYKGP